MASINSIIKLEFDKKVLEKIEDLIKELKIYNGSVKSFRTRRKRTVFRK